MKVMGLLSGSNYRLHFEQTAHLGVEGNAEKKYIHWTWTIQRDSFDGNSAYSLNDLFVRVQLLLLSGKFITGIYAALTFKLLCGVQWTQQHFQ